MPDTRNYFTRSFNSLITKLPYSGNNMVIDNLETLNPKFETFHKVGKSTHELLQKQAVSVPEDLHGLSNLNGVVINKGYHDYLYALVDTDKFKRVADYRIMASYAEISHALDEICDEMLVKDDRGNYLNFTFKGEFEDNIKKTLVKNFNHVVELFNLENKGFEYFRTILIDSEIYFENIINDKKKEAGILGVVQIPTEHVNPIYDNVQNMIIKGFILRKPVIDKMTQRTPQEYQLIPLEKHQVTYFHSHLWNESKTIRLPYIEIARRAYKQLSLIEDSIVVYRLVRAPERLAFYVDVGNMPAPKAEAYIKRLMQNYWSRRTFDSTQGKTTNIYDPQSMLDSFWFAKRPNGDGTKVEVLPGGQNLGQLDDLNYFVKKLYKALRVPSSRLNPDQAFADGAEILREELKFAKLIMRLQRQFSSTIKDTYITHLKLKGLWDQYNLKESSFDVTFTPPSHFHTVRDQQLFEIKANNFTTMTSNEYISKAYALKKYMNWSDDEIKANREWQKKDAAFVFEIQQIQAQGPNWRDAAAGGQPPPGGPGAAPGGGGGGMPPSFGPGPGAGGSALPPEGGEGAPEMPPAGGTAPGATTPGAGPQAAGGSASALPKQG